MSGQGLGRVKTALGVSALAAKDAGVLRLRSQRLAA